jgi:hypothetical protein
MRASDLGVASLAFAGSLGFSALVYNAVQIFLLHKLDSKWGDEWGNFSLATTLVLFLVVGSLVGFTLVWIALRTGRLVTSPGKALQSGVFSGLLAWFIAVSGFGWWVTSILSIQHPSAEMAIVTSLPGVLAGAACGGVLRVWTAIRTAR